MAKKYRILIIDESKAAMAGLEAYLGLKYHILTASNGRDGIQTLEKNEKRIHLVLTELILPDFFGGNLVSLIKKRTPGKPVIAMSGWGYGPEELEPKVNADLILEKPFEMEELEQAIEKLLSKIHEKKVRSRATPKKRKQ